LKEKEDKIMDLNEIKKIIEEEGCKIIVVEQGQPVMVITSFEDHKKNKEKKEKKVQPVLPEEVEGEDLKIEDLPF
jgi:hypothetical protein